MTDNKCPDCGSYNAIPKHVAWDLMINIPPKTKDELEVLRAVNDTAAIIVDSVKLCHPEGTAFFQVPADLVHKLQKLMER